MEENLGPIQPFCRDLPSINSIIDIEEDQHSQIQGLILKTLANVHSAFLRGLWMIRTLINAYPAILGKYPETELFQCFKNEVIDSLPSVNIKETLKAFYSLAFLEYEKHVIKRLRN